MKSKSYVLVLVSVLLFIPFYIFAQTNSSSTPLDTASILKNFEAPKIIQNNVRITKLNLTKTEVDSNDQIIIEGNVEIKNYAKTPTSRLYMSSFVGIKGVSYYLEYPLYTGIRSDAFILEPNQTVTRPFKISEKNILKYGSIGIEVWITDEYNKQVHIESSRIGDQALAPSVEKGTVFSDFDVTLSVGDKEFVPSNGPTFYPDTEDMFLKFNFKESATFIDGARIKIFDRNFFTVPIKEVEQKLVPVEGTKNQFTLSIPKDLKPGVYPFDVELVNRDNSIFIPHIYGRFIVGGNMSKVTDVALRSENFGVQGLTLVVQGNAPDIVNPDREKDINFSAEVFAYDKNDTLLFSKKVDNQTVSIYRNIDIDFDKTIGAKKITKVKVELSDETGIFNTYTKDFTYKTSFNWWNVLFVFLTILVLVLVLILKKKKLITAFAFLLIFSSFFTNQVDAGMSPTPYKQLGVYKYDAWDFNGSTGSYTCPTGCESGLNNISPLVYSYDTDIKRFDNILDITGVNITFDQPTFYSQDPTFCYVPGQVIPVVFRYDYGICSNSPVTSCGSGDCSASSTVPISTYATIYAYTNPINWSWNMRSWEISPNHINNVNYNSSYSTGPGRVQIDESIRSYSSAVDGANFPDKFKNFDIDYLASYVDKVEVQSNSDYLYRDTNNSIKSSSLQTMNMNGDRITEVTSKMTFPVTSSYTSVPITLSGFNAAGSYSYSIIAPEKPGIYTLPFVMTLRLKQGDGYYLAQHQIKVCDSIHDADYLMPGIQTVDSSGDLKDQDGSTLTGYTIQKYPINTSSNLGNLYDIAHGIRGNVGVTGSIEDGFTYYSGWVDGFTESPDNEFNFVTTANYCGTDPLPTYDDPYLPNSLTNKWINYFSSVYNLSTKVGWYNLKNALGVMGNRHQIRTYIPIFWYAYDANLGTYIAPDGSDSSATHSGGIPNFDSFKYIVRKVDNELKFIDLSNSIFPTTKYPNTGSLINTVLKLGDLTAIPMTSFADMLSAGKFNTSADGYTHISSSTNTTANTYFIKDIKTLSNGQKTSCSIYEDFCPAREGVQYLLSSGYGQAFEIWDIDSNNAHTLIKRTPSSIQNNIDYVTKKDELDALCSFILPPLTATCSVESPVQAVDRNPNTPIQFKLTTTGLDNYNSTEYVWSSNANVDYWSDPSLATIEYPTVGSKNDVSVDVKDRSNGATIITASCPVDIVTTDFTASCTGNSVALGQTSTYTASPGGATYQWEEADGSTLWGETGQTYTTTHGSAGQYLKKVQITKSGVTKEASCYATVGNNSALTPTVLYSFDPYIAKAPPANTCSLNLDVQNVTSCKLSKPDSPDIDLTYLLSENSILTTDTEIPVGTYTLKCFDMSDPPVENSYGTRKCISNPTIKEN